MRYILLFFLLALQTSAFGSSTLQKSDAEKVLTLEKSDLEARSCEHFMYQGQYYDKEIELAYNRFRYYDSNDGRYISVDPIGLFSGEFGFYNYVSDTNIWLDVFGLSSGTIFTDSNGLSLEVKNQQDLSHMKKNELEFMAKEGTSGRTQGGRVKGSEKIALHHQKRNPKGPIIELPKSKHTQGNKKLHPFGNKKGAGVGSGKVRTDFNTWRKEYWKKRASDQLKSGKYRK